MWGMLVLALILGGGVVWLWRRNQTLQDQLLVAESQRRAIEDELDRLKHLQAGIISAIPHGLLILDRHQFIAQANPSAEILFGAELVGKSIMASIRDAELDYLVQSTLKRSAQETHEDHIEYKNRNLRVLLTPFQIQGEVQLIILLMDETELLRLSRARREMVANISHELRTPITTISLLADTLMTEGMLDKKKARKMLRDISRQTAELTQIVQEMRDLSKIESGQMPIRLTDCLIGQVIHNSIEPLLSLAEDKQQTVNVSVPNNVSVLADTDQIQRVLKNITHNAIKFTPEGGIIEIFTQIHNNEVIVAVRDTGQGISAENLPRIFERFFQEDFARSDGTGLGLAISRHIILAHGERIWVESQQGQGSTFFFTLSLASVN